MKEIEQWKMSLTNAEKSINTIKAYIKDTYELIDWLQQERQISEITLETIKSITLMDLEGFMYYLIKKKNNSPSTRARKTNAIKEFFKFLEENELIEKNIARRLKCPKIPKRDMPFLSEQECLDLIYKVQGCHRVRDIAIITLFLNTGLRLSELVSIDVDDVKGKTSFKIVGKGNKERTIYLNDIVSKTLNDWLRIRPEIKNQPALFVSERKNRISIKSVQFMVKENLKRINRDDCYVHAFRHSFCTLMLKKGVDLRTIQEAAGHSSIQTTEKYTHVVETQMKDAINKMNIGWSDI